MALPSLYGPTELKHDNIEKAQLVIIPLCNWVMCGNRSISPILVMPLNEMKPLVPIWALPALPNIEFPSGNSTPFLIYSCFLPLSAFSIQKLGQWYYGFFQRKVEKGAKVMTLINVVLLTYIWLLCILLYLFDLNKPTMYSRCNLSLFLSKRKI